jgi:hypothetical protein
VLISKDRTQVYRRMDYVRHICMYRTKQDVWILDDTFLCLGPVSSPSKYKDNKRDKQCQWAT